MWWQKPISRIEVIYGNFLDIVNHEILYLFSHFKIELYCASFSLDVIIINYSYYMANRLQSYVCVSTNIDSNGLQETKTSQISHWSHTDLSLISHWSLTDLATYAAVTPFGDLAYTQSDRNTLKCKRNQLLGIQCSLFLQELLSYIFFIWKVFSKANKVNFPVQLKSWKETNLNTIKVYGTFHHKFTYPVRM